MLVTGYILSILMGIVLGLLGAGGSILILVSTWYQVQLELSTPVRS